MKRIKIITLGGYVQEMVIENSQYQCLYTRFQNGSQMMVELHPLNVDFAPNPGGKFLVNPANVCMLHVLDVPEELL